MMKPDFAADITLPTIQSLFRLLPKGAITISHIPSLYEARVKAAYFSALPASLKRDANGNDIVLIQIKVPEARVKALLAK